MSVSRAHSLYAALIDATVIPGMTAQAVNMNTEAPSDATSAEVWSRWVSMTAQNPRATFTTKALVTLLDALAAKAPTADKYSCNIANLTAGLSLYAQAFAAGSTRAGASLHRKFVAKHGCLGLRRLSCTHQQDATLECEAVIGYDGTNDPVVETDLVNLPSISGEERFTLGPITLQSISIPEVRSLDIDFGLEIDAKGADSDIWPTFVTIGTIKPVITIRGIDLEWLKAANIPRAGKAITHTNTTIYLRKRALGSTVVADETEEHIKLTAAGFAYVDTPTEASGSDAAEASLIVPCYFDGTNDPIVIDTTSAIP